MNTSRNFKELLKSIPKTDKILQKLPGDTPPSLKLRICRRVLDDIRHAILSGNLQDISSLSIEEVTERIRRELQRAVEPSLKPLINATGVVVHTNLGRSLLPEELFEPMFRIAANYSNLEYDLENGKRGSRYSHVEDILCELTGAEAALVVNNNAAAVLISLETLAKGKEVIVSRGELVEIGGSFRIPDVMARSGAILKEVGATNRTHLADYERAIGENTALLMKVHQSNFAIVGFTRSVSMANLKALGDKHGLPVIEDLGSGNLIDLTPYGFIHEPTVKESLEAGADLVSFSGDKMLGGPQAGIIVGKRKLVDKIRKNPINRAVRIDKLTLAALEGTLRIYREPEKALSKIPTLKMLSMSQEETKLRAENLRQALAALGLNDLDVDLTETISRVGGGALPLQNLRSTAVTLELKKGTGDGKSGVAGLERELRLGDPPVIVRIEDDRILMDVRTIKEDQFTLVAECVRKAAVKLGLD
ncbi:MAG: L-seryl-tRNA(Sec) selenium transferase [Thermodesulfatator sp.]|nr:MAG: L-seryl-tRNA(Sec) selenium transferase [Thermodesulfatator sp.]